MLSKCIGMKEKRFFSRSKWARDQYRVTKDGSPSHADEATHGIGIHPKDAEALGVKDWLIV